MRMKLGERFVHLLEIGSLYARISFTVLNIKCNYLIKDRSFKQYAVGFTCFFYYIRPKVLMKYFCRGIYGLNICKVEVHLIARLSYASPPVQKLHPHSDIISKLYKPTFLATHLIAVLQSSGYSIFHGRRYSYSTRSSMTKLPY